MFEAYEHTVAPALIRAADRVCVLSPDHAESVPYLRRAGERDPAKLVEMPNGVDAELFSPGADAAVFASGSAIPADAVVAAFVATLDRAHHFKRLDVAIDAPRRGSATPSVHLVVAGGGELLDGFRARAAEAGRRRPRPLPRRRPARRAARRCCAPPTSSCSPPSRRSRSGSS